MEDANFTFSILSMGSMFEDHVLRLQSLKRHGPNRLDLIMLEIDLEPLGRDRTDNGYCVVCTSHLIHQSYHKR